MAKTLEQYLSDQEFDIPAGVALGNNLSSSERAFVEKYLGLDILQNLTEVNPEPVMSMAPQPQVVNKTINLAPVKEQPEIVIADNLKEKTEIIVAVHEEEKDQQLVNSIIETNAVSEETEISEIEDTLTEIIQTEKTQTEQKDDIVCQVSTETTTKDVVQSLQLVDECSSETTKYSKKVETSPLNALREHFRQQDTIQMISFYVEEQLFLLPIEGVREVLKYMEAARVPQAPQYVAGVINLRGKTTPLIHLAGLITNTTKFVFDKKKFIIIYGADDLQLGLIIDKIDGMHIIPQNKIIWNVESRIGDAGEYIFAIADLNDKVCGMVAPEMITYKLLGASEKK